MLVLYNSGMVTLIARDIQSRVTTLVLRTRAKDGRTVEMISSSRVLEEIANVTECNRRLPGTILIGQDQGTIEHRIGLIIDQSQVFTRSRSGRVVPATHGRGESTNWMYKLEIFLCTQPGENISSAAYERTRATGPGERRKERKHGWESKERREKELLIPFSHKTRIRSCVCT